MCALTAAVEVSLALWARAVEVDARRSLCAARGALRRLAECHHAWRARALAILRLRLRLGLRLWSLRLAIAVHITALTVFAHIYFNPSAKEYKELRRVLIYVVGVYLALQDREQGLKPTSRVRLHLQTYKRNHK
jgi:hypothetical protein